MPYMNPILPGSIEERPKILGNSGNERLRLPKPMLKISIEIPQPG